MITENMIAHRKDLLKMMNLVVLSDYGIVDEGLWKEWSLLVGSDESNYEEVARDNDQFHYALRTFLVMNAYFYEAEEEA
jgi:hypothetical protein